jgi:hypothetical protein
MRTKGTIDGLYYEVTVWDQPGGFGAQAIITHHRHMVWWEIGTAEAPVADDAQHLAIFNAYKAIAKKPRPDTQWLSNHDHYLDLQKAGRLFC